MKRMPLNRFKAGFLVSLSLPQSGLLKGHDKIRARLPVLRLQRNKAIISHLLCETSTFV